MSINIRVDNFQLTQAELRRALDKFRAGKVVTVGIHEDAVESSNSEITMAQLGAIHEFGAEINHPGGTAYGYTSKEAEEKKQVRFLGNSGDGAYKVLGKTQPHVINIPARPWLVPGAETATPDIIDVVSDGVKNGNPLNNILEQIGNFTVGAVQQYMTDLKDPPNATSTIKKKGSDNPLIDTGAMRASVTWKIVDQMPDEES